MFRSLLYLIVALSYFFSSSLFAADSTPRSSSAKVGNVPGLAVLYDSLIAELKKGGTVVYFVPFDTIGVDQTDQPGWWKECAISRMISAEGLEQARAVKRAILQLNLDVQFVESSEACTALSTQTYLVGNRWLRYFITPDLNPVEVLRQSGLKDIVIQVQVLGHLQTTLADAVKFLFGFPMPPSAAPHSILSDLAPAESAIFKMSARQEPELLARLNWRQWKEMGDYFVSTKAKPAKPAKRNRK